MNTTTTTTTNTTKASTVGDTPQQSAPAEKTYLVALRRADRLLMHAGILSAPSPDLALVDYFSHQMPKLFSSPIIHRTDTTYNPDNIVARASFGPFDVLIEVELLDSLNRG